MAADFPDYLYIIVMCTDLVLAILLLRIRQRKDEAATREYFLGISLFFLTHLACRFLFLLYRIVPEVLRIFFYIGTILGVLCVVLLVLAIERTILPRTHYGFTIFGICALGIMIVDAFLQVKVDDRTYLIQLVQYIALPVLALVVVYVYLKAAKNGTGRVRKASIFMVAGITLFGLGEIANSTIANIIIPHVAYIGPFLLIGALICIYVSVTLFYRE